MKKPPNDVYCKGWSKNYRLMYSIFDKVFLEHPRSVNETYFQHGRSALGIACSLFFYCIIPICIHACVPYFFQTTASDHIFELSERLKKRRNIIE